MSGRWTVEVNFSQIRFANFTFTNVFLFKILYLDLIRIMRKKRGHASYWIKLKFRTILENYSNNLESHTMQ